MARRRHKLSPEWGLKQGPPLRVDAGWGVMGPTYTELGWLGRLAAGAFQEMEIPISASSRSGSHPEALGQRLEFSAFAMGCDYKLIPLRGGILRGIKIEPESMERFGSGQPIPAAWLRRQALRCMAALLGTLPHALFSMKTATHGFGKPCCC